MITKAQALMSSIEECLEHDPSLKLDILGIAFYKQTGIWPLFKSAPMQMHHSKTRDERAEAYYQWLKLEE